MTVGSSGDAPTHGRPASPGKPSRRRPGGRRDHRGGHACDGHELASRGCVPYAGISQAIMMLFPKDVLELIAYLGPLSPEQPVPAVPGAGSEVLVWILGSSLY